MGPGSGCIMMSVGNRIKDINPKTLFFKSKSVHCMILILSNGILHSHAVTLLASQCFKLVLNFLPFFVDFPHFCFRRISCWSWQLWGRTKYRFCSQSETGRGWLLKDLVKIFVERKSLSGKNTFFCCWKIWWEENERKSLSRQNTFFVLSIVDTGSGQQRLEVIVLFQCFPDVWISTVVFSSIWMI